MGKTQRLRLTFGASLLALSTTGCTLVGSPELVSPPPSPDDFPEEQPRAEPLSRSGNMDEYEQSGRRYRVLDTSYGYDERGTASWYGEEFQGRATSSGEPFDMNRLSAAHRTLPIPSWVRVTNLLNGRSVLLRVNDRGPFANPDARIIDVSYAAAVRLGMVEEGTVPVRVQAIEPWQTRGHDPIHR